MSSADTPTITQDLCALPLVRRMAAMVDRDPETLIDGDPLPRGWHPLLFNAPTRQSKLRADGSAALGVVLPDLGLPRLMLGGRRIQFDGDIPIGARVRRETRRTGVTEKQGRSGRFAIVNVEHRIFVGEGSTPVVVEAQDYILRALEPVAVASATDANARPASVAAPAPPDAANPATEAPPDAERLLIPDAPLLFRYSAITDNPHRIHYDLRYAQADEGYPTLVVNGSIPAMFLLELFHMTARREPRTIASRNIAPMFAGRALRLCVRRESMVERVDQSGNQRADEGVEAWRLWAVDDAGRITFEANAG